MTDAAATASQTIRELRAALQKVAEMVDQQHDEVDATEYWWPDALAMYHEAMATADRYDATPADDPTTTAGAGRTP